MEDPFAGIARRYNSTGGILRQVVRYELVDRALAEHLPGPPARVVDVGGGSGQQAIPLLRNGYEVTILDPSQEMLEEARRRLVLEGCEVRSRVRLVEGTGERARDVLGGETFDAVLCHGVLMYLETARPMVTALSALAGPGGVVSILTKNAAALAARPALEGRYADALSSLKADRDRGRLGVVTRGDTVNGLSEAFADAGLTAESWYGVRVFTDHLGNALPGDDLPEILELEWEAGKREPYRSVARMIHVIGRKDLI
ncbi:MAG: methyltransferase domain-containing protein [Rubrobacter sp.]|nr:methyltransferase domain-containing protein [Rubrobacter sp.]